MGNENGGEKREKVLGTENDELDWTEQVMRKRSRRRGESKAQRKGRGDAVKFKRCRKTVVWK